MGDAQDEPDEPEEPEAPEDPPAGDDPFPSFAAWRRHGASHAHDDGDDAEAERPP